MSPPARVAWRAFPWNAEAEEGEPFSASFVPMAQGWGRFDRPGEPTGVLYLAETAEHAVAEKIQDLRNQAIEPGDLGEYGYPLALVAIELPGDLPSGLADLCDPDVLAQWGIAPDDVCARDRTVTQGISSRLHAEGFPGFRWWSAFFGEWHTLVLFRDRLGDPPLFGTPAILTPSHPALTGAALALGIEVRGG